MRFEIEGLRAGAVLLLILSAELPIVGVSQRSLGQMPAPAQASSGPAMFASRGPVAFQPGVWIDWQRREVLVQTRVVLRAGMLEFLACWPGKEHESIVRCEAAAAHVYMALGLIGVLPGHPPVWNPETGQYGPPAGDLVDISFRWEQDGRTRTAGAYDWLREVEYGRPPLERPWVFAGSLLRPDGTLAADVSGVGVALVDFPDSLICLSRRYPSRYGELWAEANSAAIPAEETVVRLILRPARLRRLRVKLDFRGALWVDGRYCSTADLAELLSLARRLDPAYVQTIDVAGALRSDEHRLHLALLDGRVPADALRFVASSAAP